MLAVLLLLLLRLLLPPSPCLTTKGNLSARG
jgi:hypothetical protein